MSYLTTTTRPNGATMIKHRFVTATLAVIAFALTPAVSTAAPTDFGIESVTATASSSQAGAHPDFATTFEVKLDPDAYAPSSYARLQDATVSLPPGLLGNPRPFPTCPMAVFGSYLGFGTLPVCPQDTQVGLVRVKMIVAGTPKDFIEPLFNLPAPAGSPARLGFEAFIYPTVIDFRVRSDGDYGLDAIVRGANPAAALSSVTTTVWGVPADPSHDADRLTPNESCVFICNPHPPRESGLPEIPFMSNATSCGPSSVGFDLTTYDLGPDLHFAASAPLETVTECDAVPFDPQVSVSPTSASAHAPTGMGFEIALPQDGFESPNVPRSADLRKAVVTLPEGMTINPSSAHGLDACSEAQIGLIAEDPPRFNTDAPQCPDASKVGSVRIDTPVLSEALTGSLYLAEQSENPFHSLLAGYLVAKANGVLIKLAGRFDLDQSTGRVRAIFDNNPQLPFSKLHLEFFGGPHGPLTNPSCGNHSIESVLDGWNGAQVVRTTQFVIDQACTPQQFKPEVEAGLTNPVAGASSTFSLRVRRSDADSEFKSVATALPPGLLAKVAGVPLCSSANAMAGTCPEGSRIGSVAAGAGSGSDPFYIRTGKVFLTEGYKGAPFGLSVAVPAIAGPFDLGVVNVRAALNIDPVTAQASVEADPMPRILQGIPLQVRDLRVTVDRDEFVRAPTSCDQSSVRVAVGSYLGETADLSSRFQIGGCSDLGFTPKLALRVTGKKQMKTGGHPGIKAAVTQAGGQAGIDKAVVRLPKALALDPDNAQALCEFVDGTKPDLENHCPKGSIVGRAKAVTPLLDKPISGNVYFVKNVRTDPRTGNQIRTLPMIVVALRGEIAINLKGVSSAKGGQLVNTFASVPDAPVSKFNLNIAGGQNGILVVTRTTAGTLNLCSGRHAANVAMRGHNGKTRNFATTLKRPCGKSGAATRKGRR